MEIGTNEDFFDEIDDVEPQETEEQPLIQEEEEQEVQEPPTEEDDDFLTSFLKSRGIEDKSKIKFENEEGSVEEVDWDSLSNEDKLNILKSSEETPEDGLDDTEIQLINEIRNSGMTPAEYLEYVGKGIIERYIQNTQEPKYEIDQYSDDELFLMDFMSRMGEVTQDEATEALERAKANESLYKKQVEAIRNEYRQAEKENQMYAQMEQDNAAKQQFEQFSNQIVDAINDLTEIQSFDLNMNDEDKQTLYDFITGQDAAGNNYLAKALSDPKILTKTAWLVLNGDQMVDDIADYFKKEIADVREKSYKKGAEDAHKKVDKSNNVVFKDKPKSQQQEVFSDLDDF